MSCPLFYYITRPHRTYTLILLLVKRDSQRMVEMNKEILISYPSPISQKHFGYGLDCVLSLAWMRKGVRIFCNLPLTTKWQDERQGSMLILFFLIFTHYEKLWWIYLKSHLLTLLCPPLSLVVIIILSHLLVNLNPI